MGQTLPFSSPLTFSPSPSPVICHPKRFSDCISPRLRPHRARLPSPLPGLLPHGPCPLFILSTIVPLVFLGYWSSFCYSCSKALAEFPGFLTKTSTLNVVAGLVCPLPCPPPWPRLLPFFPCPLCFGSTGQSTFYPRIFAYDIFS